MDPSVLKSLYDWAGYLFLPNLFLFVFSECGKKIVGDASGVGHSTGIESGPTEVDLHRHLFSPEYVVIISM